MNICPEKSSRLYPYPAFSGCGELLCEEQKALLPWLSIPSLSSLPTRYYCEKCKRIAKKGPTCATCEGALTRHDLKMTRFRLVSSVCWALAIFFLFWPFLAPPELTAFFYLAFLFMAIAIPMEWFDARVIAIRVMTAVRESKGP